MCMYVFVALAPRACAFVCRQSWHGKALPPVQRHGGGGICFTCVCCVSPVVRECGVITNTCPGLRMYHVCGCVRVYEGVFTCVCERACLRARVVVSSVAEAEAHEEAPKARRTPIAIAVARPGACVSRISPSRPSANKQQWQWAVW